MRKKHWIQANEILQRTANEKANLSAKLMGENAALRHQHEWETWKIIRALGLSEQYMVEDEDGYFVRTSTSQADAVRAFMWDINTVYARIVETEESNAEREALRDAHTRLGTFEKGTEKGPSSDA